MGPWLEPSGARGAFERLGVHEGSHMGPRSPSRTKMDPSWGHVRPRWAHHDPRWAPSWTKMVPSWFKIGPRWSKLGQDEPKLVQDGSKLDPRGAPSGSGAVYIGFYTVPEARSDQGLFSVLGEGARLYIYIRSRDSGALAGAQWCKGSI